MNFCVKLLSVLLVLVMLATTVASCAPQSTNRPTTPNGTTSNNVVVVPPVTGGDDNGNNNGDDNNGNHVGGVVVGNVTAPYIGDVHVSAGVTPDENNQVPSEGVNLESSTASAIIPGGVQMEEGTNELALTINGIKDSSANVELSDTDVSSSLDVHVSGVAAGNLVPMEVKLLAAALKGLNSTSITLYHVENGETIAMTYVPSNEPFTAHNQFKYDPATGDVTLYIASFSEIMMVADTDNAWEGNFDYTWYDASKTELTIANADQLAAFGAIVGGMAAGIEQDAFSGKTVKLIADINLGDKESENKSNIIFYPIGYNSSDGKYEKTGVAVTTGFYNFCGTFDGNGHTIENFYQNTWEMKGDNNYYDATLQYYRDGMGLFGRVYGGTVKNLTVSNFSSDGEYTTTGVIAAYADGTTFENISVFNCNPRVYNIGNGGIVGCVGWYAKEADLKTTFKNITVDNSNKISALWGSYDVACGGIVGQYYPTSGQTSAGTPANGGVHFENCHISAQMDVYNDVCANYQYYAYRYTGMLIGSVRENVTIDGHVYPKMDGITASGCTVHFGTWNDYYYCEIIDNTTASYTHDYQMSRLTEIKAIDGTTITYLDGTEGTVPASGRANYVIVDYSKGHGTENATCYHFKDGAVWTHDMGGIQEGIDENGDGKDDLKEDKQHIYLEFNNLVTGYGWGVTTVALTNLENVNIKDTFDITGGDVEGSETKFEYKHEGKLEIGKVYTLGELFNGLTDNINSGNVVLKVSPVGSNTTVDYTYTMNTTDWTQGTLVLRSIGDVEINITDYYFCKSTKATATVDKAHKFEYLYGENRNGAENPLHKDFLLRVGNQNAVALNLLFGEIANCYAIDINTLEVTTANGTFKKGNTWVTSTINFEGFTGVTSITIEDATSYECTINVEVVDGLNTTSATSATSGNIVLLNNIGSGFTVSGEYTFFGNGFTLTYTGDGRYLNNGLKQGLVTVSENGTLDNLRIEASIYPSAFMYYGQTIFGEYVQNPNNPKEVEGEKTRYYYQLSSVVAKGNATVSNCYIYGGRTNIFVDTGNVTVKDTILECGTVANMQIQSTNEYTVTLENVTTIQHQVNPTVGDATKIMLGAGILVGPDTTSNPNIVLNGSFKQYNWVSNNDYNAVSDEVAKMLIEGALKATAYNHTINGATSSNLGIIFMNTAQVNITNTTGLPYKLGNVTMTYNKNDVDGQVYSLQNATTSQIYSDYVNADRTTVNGDYLPTFIFDLGDQLDPDAGNGDNRYLYGDKYGVFAIYQDGNDPITLDLSKIASIYKYIGVPYSITARCLDANGNVLPQNNNVITLDAMGTYTLVFTVTDNIFYDKDGNRIEKSVERTFEVPLKLDVKAADIKNAVVNITKTALDGEYNTVNLTDYELRIKFLDCISITDYDNKGNGTTVNLSSNISSATLTPSGVNVFTTAFTITITYTDGRVLTVNFSKISGSSPGTKTGKVNTSGSVYFTTEGALNNKPTEASSQNKCTITSVSFKGNSGSTVTNDTDVTVTWALGSSGGSSPCVTGDTLVTLADGTQKRIDAVTTDDMLLVWNHFTGNYDAVPAAIIFNHGYDNNTVIKLNFSDGTQVKVTNLHQFFDADLNKYVSIDATSVGDYVGHGFVKQSGDSYTTVTLDSYEISEEYLEAYGIISALHYNILVEGMFSTDFMVEDYDLFNYFAFGEGMMFDEEMMKSDIEKYGLYTYEDFADYLTYEQFVGFNVQYFKIAVDKGLYTYDGILDLIDEYLNN